MEFKEGNKGLSRTFKIYPTAKIVSKKFKHGKVGDICDFTFIACDTEIGERSHIANHCCFVGKGKLKIGNGVTIAPHVIIYTSFPDTRLDKNKYCKNHNPIIGDVIIEDDVFIGTNSVISAGVRIKKNTVIGACSFINKDTEKNSLYFGIPAKKQD